MHTPLHMWQLTPGQSLRWRRFDDLDDQFVLYNDLSGDTHLLGDSAMHLLGLLQQGPASNESLCAAVAAALDCPRDSAFDGEAGAVLDQLARLSVISPFQAA